MGGEILHGGKGRGREGKMAQIASNCSLCGGARQGEGRGEERRGRERRGEEASLVNTCTGMVFVERR